MMKQYYMIKSLPETPDKPILWMTPSKRAKNTLEKEIIKLRGQEYLDKYVKVIVSEPKIYGNKSKVSYYDDY